MCGIIGYIGEKKANPIILNGLRHLEYRGYDSCGIALWDGNSLTIKKDVGKVDEVHSRLNFLEPLVNLIIAHKMGNSWESDARKCTSTPKLRFFCCCRSQRDYRKLSRTEDLVEEKRAQV